MKFRLTVALAIGLSLAPSQQAQQDAWRMRASSDALVSRRWEIRSAAAGNHQLEKRRHAPSNWPTGLFFAVSTVMSLLAPFARATDQPGPVDCHD